MSARTSDNTLTAGQIISEATSQLSSDSWQYMIPQPNVRRHINLHLQANGSGRGRTLEELSLSGQYLQMSNGESFFKISPSKS